MAVRNINKNKNTFCKKFAKVFFVAFSLAVIILGLYLLLYKTGLWQKINSIEKIKNIVEKGGVFSCLIFVALQILQTTILQIPAIVITVAGSLIFGKWLAFMLSFIAIMLGSVIMFWIGRKAGVKFLKFLIGEEKTNKWIKRIGECKYLFVLMMLFPLFPDDILCVVAGLSNMSFKFFFITNLIARFIGVGCTIFFATGSIIPFSGWGLIVWGLIAIFILYTFYASIKYQNKIDNTIKSIFTKK